MEAMRTAQLALASLLVACSIRHDAPVRVDAIPQPKVYALINLQRTMRLLATSTALQPNRVRVLFYGQSITQSGWSRTVARELARRFPHAELEVENRAIGGFSSEYLAKSAATDIDPYYPDLVILHAYGSHFAYEQLVRHIRERTTAEILIQNDHVLEESELEEERDPSLLAPDEGVFTAFMNHAFLPKIAARYDATLCDQRSAWKRFLKQRKLPPAALLVDHVHLNAAGDHLMAELVLRCLRYAPDLGRSPNERSVETILLRDHPWQEGKLSVPFHGNRIDAVANGSGSATVLIDGRPPSTWRELHAFTRARVNGAVWPPLYDIHAAALPLVEDWALRVDRATGEPPHYTFELIGSKSGRDGRGETRRRFVSNSQRVVIEPDDWNIDYAFELAGIRPVPPRFTIAWSVEPRFADTLEVATNGRPASAIVTLAQGLPNAEHLLELRAAPGDVPVTELRVYRPPGDPAQPLAFPLGERP
jgi:lysophospholipase L1-like esterase